MSRLRRTGVALALAAGLVGCRADVEPARSVPGTPGEVGPEPSRTPAEVGPEQVASPLHALPTGLEVYLASSDVRVVDPVTGEVRASMPLKKAVRDIRFTRDGSRGFLATSAGVFAVDPERAVIVEQLTSSPVSQIRFDGPGEALFVLEHDVRVLEDGRREVLPFRLRSLDVLSGRTRMVEEVGDRIASVLPSQNGKHHVVLSQTGLIQVGLPQSPLVDSAPIRPQLEHYRLRSMAVGGDRAFVALEGEPSSELVEVDLVQGTHRSIALLEEGGLRAVAATEDGERVVAVGQKRLYVLDGVGGRVESTLDLTEVYQGLALSPDGRFAFLMRTIDGTGGSVSWVQLDPPVFGAKILIADISPWAIAVRPTGAN